MGIWKRWNFSFGVLQFYGYGLSMTRSPVLSRHFFFFGLPLLVGGMVFFLEGWSFGGAMDWREFRGPTGQGVSTAVNLPVVWSATTHLGWKVEIPGQGWSSPVLSGGRIYLTSAVGDSDKTLHAICLDATDGRTIWDTEVFHPDPGSVAKMHAKNSAASGSPIVTDDRLYVHFGHMGTAALDLQGKVLWRQTELSYPPVHGTGSTPILFDGKLIFNCDGAKDPFVVALDAATGVIRWKTPRNTSAKKPFSFCTPLAISVDGVAQVISPGAGFVGGYDPQDGREIWRVGYGEGYSVVPRPVFAHGLLYISSSFDAAVLYAINPAGAKGDVTAKNVVWSTRKSAPHSASTLVVGDELYFVSDAGIATCADAKTGTVYWSERLGGGFSASPFSAEGRVYFQNEAGITLVVEAIKTYKLLSTNDIGERTLASSAVADGAIYLRSIKHLWKIVP